MNSLKYTQYFLNDPSIAKEMLNHAQINSNDMVMDIGAGKGALTSYLSRKADNVIAVELDSNLAGSLKKSFSKNPVVKILNLDFLEMPLPNNHFKVVANIPYNITTDIFGQLLDIPLTSFIKGTIITEWGAAKRFTKHTTDPRIIGWNTWFNIDIISQVSPASFSPTPLVKSAVVKIERQQNPIVNPKKYYQYIAFVASLLEYPQVRVRDVLKSIFTWNQIKRISSDAGINRNHPIANLNVEQWAHCFNTMHKLMPKRKRVHPSMPGRYKRLYAR